MEKINANEKSRRLTIAVANWLCGTLEGFACDNADITLAKELDSWLQKQKSNYQTLYIGPIVCDSCNKTWECLVVSNSINSIQCPHCGTVQKKTLLFSNQSKPQNYEALENVKAETDIILSKIEQLNNAINKKP